MGHMIELKAADGTTFPAYVAGPAGNPKAKGGLVLLQEIFGVNSHIRAVADGYAADGYFVVAPATFHRVQANVDLGYTEADMGTGFGFKTAVDALPAPGVMADIQAAIDHAAQAGKVGIVGYCWGGLLTWRAACMLDGLSAAVPYYGGGVTTPDEIARHLDVGLADRGNALDEDFVRRDLAAKAERGEDREAGNSIVFARKGAALSSTAAARPRAFDAGAWAQLGGAFERIGTALAKRDATPASSPVSNAAAAR